MPQNPTHYLGMDFGTSNSCLSIIPARLLSPNPVEIDGRDIVPTAVLLEANGEEAKSIAFGWKAIDEWGMSTKEERKARALHLNFKPELSTSESARSLARTFLSCVAEHMNRNGLLPGGRKASGLPFFVGAPADARAAFEEALRSVARDAGFGETTVVKEPVGALVHHLVREDIPAEEAQTGVLVVDFGGGTLDVAYMRKLRVVHAWGDPNLGGRLFDDLFFQWYCDQNPNVRKRLAKDPADEYFIHWRECREMKERFSETVSRNRDAAFRYNIPGYGAMRDATWEEFQRRARGFTPTSGLWDMLSTFESGLSERMGRGQVDLLAWVRETLEAGFRQGAVRVGDVRWVILTGGSSAWPFVKDMLTQDVGLDDERVHASANPRRAIGEGLAMLPVYKAKNRERIDAARNAKPKLVDHVADQVVHTIEAFVARLVSEAVPPFFDTHLRPVLVQYRQQGGSVAELRQDIEAKCPHFERAFEARMREKEKGLHAKIEQKIRTAFSEWFHSHDLVWNPESGMGGEGLAKPGSPDISEAVGFSGPAANVAGLAIAVIVAELCGGAGIALLMSGPVGWIIGFALALAALFYGRSRLEKARLPAWAMRGTLTETRIHALPDKIQRDILAKLRERFASLGIKDRIRAQVEAYAERQIASLEALDDL